MVKNRNLHSLMGGKEHTGDIRNDWMTGVEGIVAINEDPERMHRIKVIIPVINESQIYDEWVSALLPWVGTDGYGPVNLPALNSEVVLFGRLAEKHNLYYLSRYNEDFHTPAEFDGARGMKTETAYKLLADLFIEVVSQQTILVQAATRADVKSQLVRLLGGDGEVFRAEPGKSSFHAAASIARRALPAPATDLASCITLTNAIRTFLIDWGACQ
jgi:hypothetical protein